jgi:hypothetical protein
MLPELGTLDAERGGQGAAQRDGESCPQLSGVRLPQHRCLVVVAVWVERGADARVVGVVASAERP